MLQSPFPGPQPLYNNVPINAQYYQPSRFVITNIALGQTTIVTTSINHNYVIGQNVRLLIPQFNGCRQLNETQSYVISIPAQNQVELALDSSIGVNAYQTSTYPTQPQILAIGEVNTGAINTSNNPMSPSIPGAFIDIENFGIN